MGRAPLSSSSSQVGIPKALTMRRILFLFAGLTLLAGPCIASSSGKEFVTAFMTNLKQSKRNSHFELVITRYHPATKVIVKTYRDNNQHSVTVREGETFQLPTSIEMLGTDIFDGAVQITADKDISVLSRSRKDDTTGATVIYPVEQLGTLYYVVTPEGDMANTFKEFAVVPYKTPTSQCRQYWARRIHGLSQYKAASYAPTFF
ncbi:IgGFc-binding protein-like [Elgaria multicarinata webbii]|uniref:IgGFc-binding protein-like n=1 Tax=Elgaria multicarinata webbii TaxID=159646 RepID=UPI002FCD51F4